MQSVRTVFMSGGRENNRERLFSYVLNFVSKPGNDHNRKDLKNFAITGEVVFLHTSTPPYLFVLEVYSSRSRIPHFAVNDLKVLS